MVAVTLLAPMGLWLALAIPLVWFLPRPLRDRTLGVLRSLILLLLAFAAARPVTFSATDDAWHVVVLDAHGSTADTAEAPARARARALVEDLPDGAHAVLVRLMGGRAFGEWDSESLDPRDETAFDRVVYVGGRLSFSSLARGLEAAGRAIPRGARGAVTLLTDGRATDRRWGPAVQDLQVRGIPVHTIQLPAEERRAAIVGFDRPALLRVGHVARFGVRLTGTEVVDVELVRAFDDVIARAEGVRLAAQTTVPLDWEPREAGVHSLQVRVTVQGERYESNDTNLLWVQVAVQEPLRVLYLGERMAEGGARLADLVGRGFAFDDVGAGQAPTSAQIRAADLIMVDDRSAEGVPEAVQTEIARAVIEGHVGLVMAGGRGSFGAGGWHRAPLARVLPVEMIQKEEKRDPSTALVLIIDTSGSMGGNRVQLAKEVARLAIRRLLPHDKVGIVEFYGAKRWAAPLQPASNAIEIQRALNRLNAGGGTVIMPAIEEAFYGLQNVRTRYKHVLVLTDGGVETGAFEPLVRRMADKGITVSTVLIGPGMHSEFLVNIANWGKGRFYGVPNRFNLPEVILKQPASAHLPPWRPGTHPLKTGGASGWWQGIDRETIPPLSGYVEARARPGAETLLEVAATKHPVLATWRYGLGRATALLTEPTGPGTSSWRDWEGYGAWLARVLARTAADTHAPYSCHARQDERLVVLTVHRLRPDAPAPLVEFHEGSDVWRTVVAAQRTPDRFEVRVPPALAPAFHVRTETGAVPIHVVPRETWTWEHHEDPATALDLSLLAEATGGAHTTLEASAAFRPTVGGGTHPIDVVPLWPWCLLLALLLYIAELAWRRRPSGATR